MRWCLCIPSGCCHLSRYSLSKDSSCIQHRVRRPTKNVVSSDTGLDQDTCIQVEGWTCEHYHWHIAVLLRSNDRLRSIAVSQDWFQVAKLVNEEHLVCINRLVIVVDVGAPRDSYEQVVYLSSYREWLCRYIWSNKVEHWREARAPSLNVMCSNSESISNSTLDIEGESRCEGERGAIAAILTLKVEPKSPVASAIPL